MLIKVSARTLSEVARHLAPESVLSCHTVCLSVLLCLALTATHNPGLICG